MTGKTRYIAPHLICENMTRNGRNELQILNIRTAVKNPRCNGPSIAIISKYVAYILAD